jgi:hypothetical protein
MNRLPKEAGSNASNTETIAKSHLNYLLRIPYYKLYIMGVSPNLV